jgi:hypothetical protein
MHIATRLIRELMTAAVDYLSNNRVFMRRMAFSRRGFNRF